MSIREHNHVVKNGAFPIDFIIRNWVAALLVPRQPQNQMELPKREVLGLPELRHFRKSR